MAAVQARLLNASDDERVAAAEVAERALAHDLFVRARAALSAGRACQREVPLAVMAGDVLVDGQADAAFDDGAAWLVVDFKTDVEIAFGEPAYRLQVALYADAIARAYGRDVEAVLLRV
jgi:ATP-dependent exoDNAse (exonuclease V) beta subunit